MRTLGSIATATVVGLAVFCAAMILLVFLLWPAEVPDLMRSGGFPLQVFAAAFLTYFSVASLVARKASHPWSTLVVGAVVSSAVFALWFTAGLGYGTTPSEAWMTALGGTAILSVSLLLGSAALYRLGALGRPAGEASPL